MQLNFNAYDYDPSQGTAICFPLADYKVEISAAEPKVVKENPSAGYLELSLTISEGDCRGMVQKDRLNLFSTSEIAKRIAHQQLSAYCFAIGRPFVQHSEELLGGRCICTIGPQDNNDKYSDVKVVKCMDGSLPTKQQTGPQAVQQGPPAPPAPPAQPQAPPGFQQPAQATTAAQAPPWNTPAPAATAPAQPSNTPPWASSVPTQPPAGGVPPWAK